MIVCYQLTFCDANGTRKDRRNGGLYVTEDAQTAPTISTSHNEGLVILEETNETDSDIHEPCAGQQNQGNGCM